MEVFRAPHVTLIARPEFLEPEHLRVQWQGNASSGERLAEFAGRICYMSQHNPAHRSTPEYLENIKKQGHGSVLEHAVYVLLIEGISRSCTHARGAPCSSCARAKARSSRSGAWRSRVCASSSAKRPRCSPTSRSMSPTIDRRRRASHTTKCDARRPKKIPSCLLRIAPAFLILYPSTRLTTHRPHPRPFL